MISLRLTEHDAGSYDSGAVRHVFIVDPLPGLLPGQDTSIAFMREAQRRGHALWTGQIGSLGVGEGGRSFAWLQEIRLTEAEPWYQVGVPVHGWLHEFDVVWMRKDPPYDLAYFYATHLLSLVSGPTLVVNDPAGLRNVDEKLFATRYPDLVPETLISSRVEELLSFRDKFGGEMVLKPLGGRGGEGIFHLTPGDRNTNAILETATQFGTRPQIAQRYIPEIRYGDKRILLLEGRPIGAVLRIPRHGEFRANFHVGGVPARAEITDRDREICARLEPGLRENGILFAGIDVIGDFLTEVNVTSPTGREEINALDGTRLEAQVLDTVERLVAERRRGA